MHHTRPSIEIPWTERTPFGACDWAAWQGLPTLDIACFRPESSDHRPRTQAKFCYDSSHLYGIYRVCDHYVRCRFTEFQSPVCQDSCVEFFVRPRPDGPYLNFEFNAIGTVLCSCVRDWRRVGDGFADHSPLTPAQARGLRVRHSLEPGRIDPEQVGDQEWCLEFALPFELFTPFLGPVVPEAGDVWQANLYKCGDETSHPHWASWSPVDELNFHLPGCFGSLVFAGA
jgi:hypothetical protein